MTTAVAPPASLKRPRVALPAPHESQREFVERCQRSLDGDTLDKTRYALNEWSRSGRDVDLSRIARKRFPQDKFRKVANRPVFTEHSKTRTVTDPHTGEEREVVEKYDRDALEAIVERCNERIRDTGDFAPLIEGHTPSSEARERGAGMPDVLGYAGPFRLGLVGNVKPRWAIFADEWHHRSDLNRLDKLQRRSAEVWLEDRMQDRFMDPIACLGAETPRLDTGISQFCRTGDGRVVEKYSSLAVEPSGANTFLPSDGGERRRVDQHSGGTNMLQPEDIQQIVEALQQTDVWQFAAQQMAAAGGPAGEGADAPAAPGDAPPPPVAAAAPPPPEPKPEENAARYECDDEDRDMFAKYMSGDMGDEDVTQYMSGKRSRYEAASGTAEEGDPGKPTDTATAARNAELYSRGANVDRGQRQDLAVQYARVEKQNRELTERLSRLETEKRDQYRRAKLSEKQAAGFVFDFDDELELSSGMSDEQFDTHVNRVVEKYERAPLASHHPMLHTPAIDSPQRKQNEKYAKERKDKIVALATRKGLSYADAEAEVDKQSA